MQYTKVKCSGNGLSESVLVLAIGLVKIDFSALIHQLLGGIMKGNFKIQYCMTAVTAIFLVTGVWLLKCDISRPVLSSHNDERHNFRLPNRVITEYDSSVSTRLSSLVARNATAADPELIRLIRDMMDPPSKNVLKLHGHVKLDTPQAMEADAVLGKKRNGFFIESGAYDGETGSNTMFLEKERGWTGLLVEMDPGFYTQLIGKNRKSWSINAALSLTNHVTETFFEESHSMFGRLLDVNSVHNNKRRVPCFPVQALLAALNRTTVDFFSLDVEGSELQVLQAISYNAVDIKVLAVEYAHGRTGKQSYVDFMKSKGYVVHKDIRLGTYPYVADFIFVKS